MRILVGVALIVGVAAVSHADPITPPSCAQKAPTTTAPKTLRDVDWCNFDYGLWMGSMRDGHSEAHLYRELGKPHDSIGYDLRGVLFGGGLAALVIEHWTWFANTDRGSSSMAIHVYDFAKGAPHSLGSIPAGTPVRDITFGKGTLSVTSGPDGSVTTTKYRRTKSGFTEIPPSK